MLTVIKDGKFTGTQYETNDTKYIDFHEAQGEICVWIEDPIIDSISLDESGEKVITYKTISDGEMIDLAKKSKRDKINAIREEEISAGMEYTFPDELVGIIQLDEASIRNIQSLATTALCLKAMGDTTTVMSFRDKENITHEMSADEMIAMALAITVYSSNKYINSWIYKDNLDALTELNEIQNFDISSCC